MTAAMTQAKVSYSVIFLYGSYRSFIGTSKSLSEAIIYASANPQYENILLIELPVQYMKIRSSELVKTQSAIKIKLKETEIAWDFRKIYIVRQM